MKPVGGRSKKAPYVTTHVRVPLPVKPYVVKLVDLYHLKGESVLSELIEELDSTDLGHSKNLLPTFEKAVSQAKVLLRQKKSARVTLQKLLTSLYGEEVIL